MEDLFWFGVAAGMLLWVCLDYFLALVLKIRLPTRKIDPIPQVLCAHFAGDGMCLMGRHCKGRCDSYVETIVVGKYTTSIAKTSNR
jgi:hypothetical protein